MTIQPVQTYIDDFFTTFESTFQLDPTTGKLSVDSVAATTAAANDLVDSIAIAIFGTAHTIQQTAYIAKVLSFNNAVISAALEIPEIAQAIAAGDNTWPQQVSGAIGTDIGEKLDLLHLVPGAFAPF